MIVAGYRQQESRDNHDDRDNGYGVLGPGAEDFKLGVNNGDLALEIEASPASSSHRDHHPDKLSWPPSPSPQQQLLQRQKEKSEDDRDKAMVSLDFEETVVQYQDPGLQIATSDHRHLDVVNVRPGLQLNNPEEDAASTSSDEYSDSTSSGSCSSETEDENIPEEELKGKGWVSDLPASLPGPLQRQVMNGLQLSNFKEAGNIGDVSFKNSTNVHIGATTLIKGPVTVICANSTSVIEEKSSEQDSLGNEYKEKDTVSANSEGPKLSTTSAHLLFPFSQGKVAEWFWTKRCTVTICVAALILLIITVLSVWLSSGPSGTTNEWHPPQGPVSPNDSSINNDPTIPGVRIVPRVEWGAQPPVHPPDPLGILPAPLVIISHTATTFCYTQAQCVLNVRVAQTFHIESKGWDDIGYNFLVGGDGLVYEGRGWDVEGAHTFNYNWKSIGISFIGTFNNDAPTKAQVHAAIKLIEYGVENGKISKDYKLLGHRQCAKTESPGDVLYNIIKTWEHWSPTPN